MPSFPGAILLLKLSLGPSAPKRPQCAALLSEERVLLTSLFLERFRSEF